MSCFINVSKVMLVEPEYVVSQERAPSIVAIDVATVMIFVIA